MVIGFVFINAEIGTEKTTQEELLNIDGVVEAYLTYGVYKITCKLQKPSIKTLHDVIENKILALANVRSTISMIVVEDQKLLVKA